jgi:hypothetical protein
MKYKSICHICGQETPEVENFAELDKLKSKIGFSRLTILTNDTHVRPLNFCYTCSRKPYTIEELKTIGNYNQWSY